MIISNEEVSRLLAYAPQGRSNNHATGSTPATENDAYALRPAADVNLSSAARDIQLAKKAVNAAPDVRADRVAALKAQVENGAYHVSGEKIADLIIRRTLADNTSF